MGETQLDVSLDELTDTIIDWLKGQLEEESLEWIKDISQRVGEDMEDWEFFSSFSAVPRYTGKTPLELTEDQLQQARRIRTGWQPERWTLDQLGRTLLLLGAAQQGKAPFLERLDKAHQSSDESEAVALYLALAVLPYPDALTDRGAEGIRSNMTSVFNAVALYNPYPADYFDEGAWNQLVLKALFVGSPLYTIYGIDRRRNRTLAEILIDYAHERWAADRKVSPELWRPVGPFITADTLPDIKRVLDNSDPLQKKAALLALSESDTPEAQSLLNEHVTLQKEIEKEGVTWDHIGEQSDDYR